MKPVEKTLTYKNHLGETLAIGGPGSVHYAETDLFDASGYEYEMAGTRIASRALTSSERTLPLVLVGSSPEERNRAYAILAADAYAGQTGELIYGDWHIDAVVTAQALGAWWFDGGIEARELTVLFPRPLWCRDQLNEYRISEASSASYPGADYPKPYDYDYGASGASHAVTVDALGDAEWLWRVWGPAADPYIIENENRHQVLVTVPAGSRLELDTRERTIFLIDNLGRKTNVIDKRVRGAAGSGTYAFARLPRGRVGLATPGSFAYDVVVYDERTSPAWI